MAKVAKTKTALVAFDYESVDKDTKGKLIALAGQIKRHGKDFIKSVMETGEAIHEAHELLAGTGRDGRFKEWIEIETGLSVSTAYEWKNVYFRAKKLPIIGSFSPTVAYLLAPESVPDEAIKEFAKQVEKGAKATVAAAKATLAKFKEISSSSKPHSAPRPAAPPKPATSHQAAATNSQEAAPAGSAGADLGKCPNCAGTKWDSDDEGVSCAKCHHPHGEPAGDVDDDRVSTQRSKTVKTVEALMRAFDDLNTMLPKPAHTGAIVSCKELLTTARGWK